MSHFSHYALQQALYSLLSDDAELSGLVSGIFDFVPAKTEFPYVTIGDSRAVDESAGGITLSRLTLTVHIYSRDKGRKEANDIMRRLRALLHDSEPEAEGGRIVGMRYQSSDIALLRDGLTYHGRMQFLCMLEAGE